MSAPSLNTKIFLVGFMGAGKTTLGRMLAERLGWQFTDLDALMEENEGASIVRIFAGKGEPYFRALEARTLAIAAGTPGRAVIACGGGTCCNPDSRERMRRAGITVWLDQPFDMIWQRRHELARERPLLSDEAGFRALYARRLEHYRSAELRLPVREGRFEEAIEELVRLIAARPDLRTT